MYWVTTDKQLLAPENTFSVSWHVLVQLPMQVPHIRQAVSKNLGQCLSYKYLNEISNQLFLWKKHIT